MKALVTGGEGFLGSHIVHQLLTQGDEVRSMGRSPLKKGHPPQGYEYFQGDITHATDCQRAVEGCDVIFHVAAMAGVWGKASLYESINVAGTQHLLQAAQAQGVQRFIYTSSPSVVFDGQSHTMATESLPYPEHWLCHYPRTKALAEQAVLRANAHQKFTTVSLRPHLIWGPGDPHLIPRLLRKAKRGKLRQIGRGQNLVDMVHVSNAAHAHILAEAKLRDPHIAQTIAAQSFFITNDEPVELWRWIKDLLQQLHIPFNPRPVHAGLAHGLGSLLELGYGALGLSSEPPMTRFVARQLSTDHTFDITKAKSCLGYRPLISMNQGTAQLIEELHSSQPSQAHL